MGGFIILIFITCVVAIYIQQKSNSNMNTTIGTSYESTNSIRYQDTNVSYKSNGDTKYQSINILDDCNEDRFYQDMEVTYEYTALFINKFSKQLRLLRNMYVVGDCKVSDQQLVNLFCKIYKRLETCKKLSDINESIHSSYFEKIFLDYFGEVYPDVYSKFRGQINTIVNIFWNKNIVDSFISIFVIDSTSDTYEAIQSSLDCVKDNATDLEVKLGVICVNIIGSMISLIKIIHIAKYALCVQNNEEFIAIARDDSTSVEEKYSIYKEFYTQIINEELDINDFRVLLNIIRNHEENSIECIEALYQTIGLDINKLILESEKETLYRDFDKICNSQGFEYLMKDNMVDSVFVSYVPYFLINKTSMKKWLLTLFEQEEFLEKNNIHLKKREILRKAKTPKIEIIKDKYNNIQTGEEFEIFLKELYEQLGYQVLLTPITGDQGADLIIEKNGIKSVIQAKFYSSTVGNSAVQEVIGAIGFYRANKGIVITNNTFTKSAKELGQANGIQLIDGNILMSIIEAVM